MVTARIVPADRFQSSRGTRERRWCIRWDLIGLKWGHDRGGCRWSSRSRRFAPVRWRYRLHWRGLRHLHGRRLRRLHGRSLCGRFPPNRRNGCWRWCAPGRCSVRTLIRTRRLWSSGHHRRRCAPLLSRWRTPTRRDGCSGWRAPTWRSRCSGWRAPTWCSGWRTITWRCGCSGWRTITWRCGWRLYATLVWQCSGGRWGTTSGTKLGCGIIPVTATSAFDHRLLRALLRRARPTGDRDADEHTCFEAPRNSISTQAETADKGLVPLPAVFRATVRRLASSR